VVKIIARLELDETISFPDGYELRRGQIPGNEAYLEVRCSDEG